MKVLLQQVHIVSSSSPFNGLVKDILIDDGIIHSIADHIPGEAGQVVSGQGLHVSTGWVDVFADFADPGYEFRETVETGAAAAASGGFTDVLVVPGTSPAVHNKSQVEYIRQKAAHTAVNVHPIGAVTKNAEGKELAEMFDMLQSGAAAFGDGRNSIQNAGLLLKALQYVKSFNGTIIQIPDDKSIGANGLMNEGIISTRLGLPGKPAMAEELMVARDIKLARYAESRLHFTGVSSPKSLEYIRRAKDAGLQISCSVTPYHLYFCDEQLQDYDANLKVNPPLRTRTDMTALRQALADGTIDCIASHHNPQNWDSKTCEFEYAQPGMIGLETLFGVMGTLWPSSLTLEQKISMLSDAPRRLFNLPVAEIKEGATASLTIFNPDTAYTFDESMIRSRSRNTPFTGQTLKGKVTGIINGKQIQLN